MIEFVRPELLWLLAGLPLVWFLHWIRGRALVTDRLEIWERALRRVPRSRRRRVDARLLLSLLVASLLALAASGPVRPERAGVRVQHVVVDLSPSMATQDAGAGRTRIAAARDAVTALRTTLPAHVPLRIWSLAEHRIEEHSGAAALRVAGGAPAETALVPRFAAFAGAEEAVFFYGDGAGPSAWPSTDEAMLRLFGFGRATQNDALLTWRLEDPWPGPSLSLTLELEVRTDGKRLVCRDESGELVAQADVPRGRYVRTLELPRLASLTLALEPRDPYPRDDVLVLAPKPPLAPLVHAELGDAARGEALVRFVVEALGGRREEDAAAFAAARGPRLLVQSGGEAAGRDAALLRVLFGTALPGTGRMRRSEGVCEWNRGDPLLSGLELSTVQCQSVREAPRAAFGSGARVLATYGQEPFIVLDPARRTLWIGASLAEANLMTQPALPVLVLRALGELSRVPGSSRADPLPDPRESDVAARPVPGPQPEIVYFEPARSYWDELLLLAAGLLLARALLR